MTCIRTSAPTERALCDPKYRTSWQREKRDGRIQANDNLVTMGKRINSTRIALGIGLFVVVVFGGEEVRAIAYGTVTGRHSPSHAALSRPVGRPSTIASSTEEK